VVEFWRTDPPTRLEYAQVIGIRVADLSAHGRVHEAAPAYPPSEPTCVVADCRVEAIVWIAC